MEIDVFKATISIQVNTYIRGGTMVNSAFTELRGHWNVLVAVTLGWLLDAFDFCLLLFLVAHLSKVFHVGLPAMALIATGTLFAKVIGNVVWGRWADRVGRKLPFMIGVAWFAFFCGLSGLAWSYSALLVFRVIFGVGFGGQWSAAAPLLMESVPENARGLASGIMMAGWEMGYLLAAGVYAIVYPTLGWRWMFFLGVIPAFLALYIARSVPESPAVQIAKVKRQRLSLNGPTIQAWAFMGAINLLTYAVFSLYPTFLTTVRHYSPGQIFPMIALYSVASIVGKPLVGHLGQLFGNRRMAMIYMVLVLPSIFFYTLNPSRVMMVIGAILMGLIANGIFGIVPAYLAERFPAASRSVGMGSGYAIAGVTGGLAPYLVAVFTAQYGLGVSMAGFIVLGALLSLLVASFQPRTFSDMNDPVTNAAR